MSGGTIFLPSGVTDICSNCRANIFLDRNGAWRHHHATDEIVHSIWCQNGLDVADWTVAVPASGAVQIFDEEIKERKMT